MSMRTLILTTATLLAAAVPLAAQESRAFVIAQPPTIGVRVDPGPPPVVRGVIPGSPADRAGIREGDVIAKVDGREATYDALREATRNEDEAVRLEIRRGEERLALEVVPSRESRPRVFVFRADSIGDLAEVYLERAREAAEAFEELDVERMIPEGLDSLALHRFRLDSLPAMLDRARLHLDGPGRVFVRGFFGGGVEGARLTELNEGLAAHFAGADRGVLVLEVEPDSRADRAGLEAGDVIVETNGRAVYSPTSLRVAIAETDRDEITLTVVRNGAHRTVRLPADD